jgi:hypothetical protein
MVKNFIGGDEPVPKQTNLATALYTIQRVASPTLTFDQISDNQALENLSGDWGCKLLRGLLYKLHKSGD